MSQKKVRTLSLDELVKSTEHIVFRGARETGRTAIAHRIALMTVDGLADAIRVPAIVDMRKWRQSDNIERRIMAHLRSGQDDFLSDSLLVECQRNLSSVAFMLCVDNFDVEQRAHTDVLKKTLRDYPNMRLLLFVEQHSTFTSGLSKLRELLPQTTQYVTIGSLPRRSIRELSTRTLTQWGHQAQHEVVNQVVNQFRDNDLPRSGYIVALLLWAWQKRVQFERVNEAALMEALIAHLLEAADFTQAVRGSFDTRLKLLLLEEIAARLTPQGGFEEVIELQKFLQQFLSQKGLRFNSVDLITALCKSGILTMEDDLVGFKYGAFQDFFSARHLVSNPAALAEAVQPNNILRFRRELDLATALERRFLGIHKSLTVAIEEGFFAQEILFDQRQSLATLGFDASKVAVNNKRVEMLRSLHVTQDALDDVADSNEDVRTAERNTRSSKDRGRVSSEGASVSSDLRKTHNDYVPALTSIVETIHLLAKVVRNAEFEDLQEKSDLTRYVLAGVLNSVCLLFNKAEDRKQEIVDGFRKLEVVVTIEEVEILLNVSKFVVPGVASIAISNDLSSIHMIPVLILIANDEGETEDIRLLAFLTLLDLEQSDQIPKFLTFFAARRHRHHKFVALERAALHYVMTAMSPSFRTKYLSMIERMEAVASKPDEASPTVTRSIQT